MPQQSLFCVFTQNTWKHLSTKIYTPPIFIAALFIHSGQDMEITEVSFNRLSDKENVVHVYNGILLSHKKRWNIAICDNMDGSWDHHAKQNKSEKVENHMISLICGI